MVITIRRKGQKDDVKTIFGWKVEDGVIRMWDDKRTYIVPLCCFDEIEVPNPPERVTTKQAAPTK